MTKSIWTKAQQKYLDDRFGKIEKDVEILKSDMSEVKSTLKLIVEILARNGMK